MKKIVVSSLFASALLVSGCQTTSTDPYTGEEKVNKTTKGAGIGAVVGAVLGNVIGKDSKATAIGAAIGTGIGAAVGNNMDSQEEELRQKLNNSGIQVIRDSEGVIKLVMPSNITFATNQSTVTPSFVDTLSVVSEVLARNPNTLIKIVGHTDSVGSASSNETLSINRAMSVFNVLQSQGVSSKRIKAFGKGELEPIADNKTEQGRSLNRRVELFIEHMPQVQG